MKDLRCAKRFATRAEAELGKSILEAEGIRSVLAADDVGGARPEIGFTTGGVQLLVATSDVERAGRALNGLGLQRVDAAESRRLESRARGCGTPVIAGMVLLLLAAFLENWVTWLGYGVGGAAALLIFMGLYRATRPA